MLFTFFRARGRFDFSQQIQQRVGIIGKALHRIDGSRLRKNDFMEFLVKILAQALVARQGHGQFFCQPGGQCVHEEGIELVGVFNIGNVA